MKRDDLKGEPNITQEHIKNNTDVRNLLAQRNIHPEKLPVAEDVRKLKSKITKENKKLPKTISKLKG